ncbi:hypothetical protein JR316_0008433 [Psilocybe cubensis]|uniref:Uncharacterized protein n=2 Tax=Psilocybe cubensis TaxID=181762 RepID=A0ACB8GVR8_PSICU|nr:hypothetical protein JR316_0008433 [Psilocybe cubensis]KAH9479838.1 hypothetical protein JR316_0008433 [Psilocybe cubensis]
MSGFRNDTFDDRDTEHLKYQGRSWFLAGFWNASNVGTTGTLSSTNGINDTVTFNLLLRSTTLEFHAVVVVNMGFALTATPTNQTLKQ